MMMDHQDCVIYGYNENGLITSVGNENNSTYYAKYIYDLNGRIKTCKINQQRTIISYKYDIQGHLRRIFVTNVNNNKTYFCEKIDYFDEKTGVYQSGNIASVDIKGSYYGRHKCNYTYDDQGHLTKVCEKNGNINSSTGQEIEKITQYSFDKNGNMLKSVDENNGDYHYKYIFGSNKISSINEKNIGHDNYGNVSQIDDINIIYDRLTGRIKNIQNGNGKSMSFWYNANNQRVIKKCQDKKTKGLENVVYIHGLAQLPLVEQSGASYESVRQYIYGPQGLIAMEDGENVYYMLSDHLGSVRVVIDKNESHVTSFGYDPFGSVSIIDPLDKTKELSESDTSKKFAYRYTGQEYDSEFNMHNYRARMYFSNIKRFLSPDPKYQFNNPYIYVKNNPINLTDPTGKVPRWKRIRVAPVLEEARQVAREAMYIENPANYEHLAQHQRPARGREFANHGNKIRVPEPEKTKFTEWRVEGGPHERGGQLRVVVGTTTRPSDGRVMKQEAWFTSNHYDSFVKIGISKKGR